jgi:hypothetical protein
MGMMHRSWPAAATPGRGSSVKTANDNKSGSPGVDHRDHRQATTINWLLLGRNSKTMFSSFYSSCAGYPSRFVISMHNAMTVGCDGEECALDIGPALKMIDATLKMAGIDTRASSNRVR